MRLQRALQQPAVAVLAEAVERKHVEWQGKNWVSQGLKLFMSRGIRVLLHCSLQPWHALLECRGRVVVVVIIITLARSVVPLTAVPGSHGDAGTHLLASRCTTNKASKHNVRLAWHCPHGGSRWACLEAGKGGVLGAHAVSLFHSC